MSMLASLLLSLAAQPAPPVPREDDTIVVIGTTMDQLARDQQQCVDQPCSVRRDAIVSIRYAEALFRQGAIAEARAVLLRARSRTQQTATRDPFAAAAIMEASATVAEHWGDRWEEGRARGAALRLLRAEAPETTRAYVARIQRIALVQDRSLLEAARLYRTLIADAREAGRYDVAAAATLRLAANRHGARAKAEAARLLDGLIAAPETPAYWVAQAELLSLRLQERVPTDADLVRIAALFPRSDGPGDAPVLLYDPPITLSGCASNCDDDQESGVARVSLIEGRQPLRWVDIRYVIAADGRVTEAVVDRASPGPQGWSADVIDAIRARRYLPPGDQAPLTRIERATLTADFNAPTGSLVRRRSGTPRVELLDLTGTRQ